MRICVMKRPFFILPVFLLISNVLHGQQIFEAIIKDSLTKSILPGVSVSANNGKQNLISDKEGKVRFSYKEYPATFIFSHSGFKTKEIYVLRPGGPPTDSIPAPANLDTNSYLTIYLQIEEKSMDEVIISSSRTNSRIKNLPTKVEVIGEEEMEEENGIKPGNIASILGDIAGIQLQQPAATRGNADMRIQGLQGKYTQILRDGLPLFGGYSGSFSILQIPPLDLKQVELIKGASSTLYGGGAIAGMINLISKRPKKGVFEKTILLNQSSLKESNVDIYLSNRK